MRSAPARVAFLAQLLLVALAAFVVLGFAQRSVAGMYEYDGPFHVRYAELLRHDLAEGRGFVRQFPWWQETFLKDHWADKDLLYHLLLIPFTFGDLDAGGKAASLFFGTSLYVCLFLALWWLRAPQGWLFTLALLASSTTLLYRAGMVRSHVVAIALASLGAAAIVRGHRTGIFLLSAAYALAHIGWHLLPGIALVRDLACRFAGGRFRPRTLLFSLAGTAAAIVVNPYFPNNLRLWYVQNVDVLRIAWSPAAPDLSLGTELRLGLSPALVYYNLGPVLFMIGGFLLVWKVLGAARVANEPDGGTATAPLALGLVTLGLILASLLSRRFVELWAPLSMMFAATALSGARGAGRAPMSMAARRWTGAALGIVIAALGLYHVMQARRIIERDPGRVFGACASWIRDNVPPGQTVFTTDWDEFPELFFVAPRQRYLVGLDPTFMYVTSPERWRLWRDVVEGRAADADDPIARSFGCRYVFADAGHEEFIERADQDPWLRCEWRDPDCGVYALREGAFDGAPPPVESWRLEGGGAMRAGPRDFIDPGRLGGTGDCATLHGRLDAPAAGMRRFAVSTDDRVRIEVNGRETFDGTAAAAPALDEVLAQQRAGARRPYERSFSVDLAAGYNDVTFSICRTGRAWGFFLRDIGQP